jgi:hypothetical protein
MATLSELRRLLGFGTVGFTTAASGGHSAIGANILNTAANSTTVTDLFNIDGTATQYSEISVQINCSVVLSSGDFQVRASNDAGFVNSILIPYSFNGATPTTFTASPLFGGTVSKTLLFFSGGYRYVRVTIGAALAPAGATISTVVTYLPVSRPSRWLSWLAAIGTVNSVSAVTNVTTITPGTGSTNLGKQRGGLSGGTDTFVPSGSIVRSTFTSPENATNGNYTIATGNRMGMRYVAPAELGMNFKLITYAGNGGLGIRGSTFKKIRVHKVWAEGYYNGTAASVALLLDAFKGTGLTANITTPTLINLDTAFPVSVLTMGIDVVGSNTNTSPIAGSVFIGRAIANIIPFGYAPSASQPLANSGKVPALDFGLTGMVLNGTAETFGVYWNQSTATGHQITMLISEEF